MIDPAIRVVIAVVVPALIARWWVLPSPALVSIGQMVLYLSLCIVPPNFERVLLVNEIQERVAALRFASYVVPSGSSTISVSEFRNTIVEKAARVWFVRRMAASRSRKLHEAFFSYLVPVLIIVVLTGAFTFVLENARSGGPQQPGPHPASPIESFAQGLIGLIPIIWIFGGLSGEIRSHRDTVSAALD
jgi:hypothetical protein